MHESIEPILCIALITITDNTKTMHFMKLLRMQPKALPIV